MPDRLHGPVPAEHGYHAPNENYDWHQARGGIVTFAKFFEEVAGQSPPA